MEDTIQEKLIKNCIEPISIKGTENILNQMKKSVCKICNNEKNGTGFFIKIPYKSNLLNVMITNNHIIDEKDILNKKQISIYINNNKEYAKIKLNNERKIYTNEILDVTIIEIKEKEDSLYKIIEYLELDTEIMNYIKLKKTDSTFFNDLYINKSIYILNY